MQTLTAFLLATVAISSCGQTAPKSISHGVLHTTVCKVLTWKSRSKVYVAMNADVFADGRHGIMLTDKDCPEQGLPLDYPLKNADASVLKFENLVTDSGTPGTIGRHVKGSFIGRILIDPKTRRMSYALLSVPSVDANASPTK